MVYVYEKLSNINKYLPKKLSAAEIKDTLIDMGMDLKGESKEKDPELKIEITAEKMDLISAVGIARAISYYRGLKKEVPKYKIKKSGLKLFVEKSVENVRSKAVCAIVRNVPMDDEFLDEIIKIQEKIHESFGRHRKKGAIGIYPLDKIKFPIYYRAEDPKKIKFRPLESDREMHGHEILDSHETGKKYAHLLAGAKEFPIFIDSCDEVLSMPPIINSFNVGKVEGHHKDLFIECSGHNLQHLDNILKILVTTFIDMGATAESIEVEYYNKEKYELSLSNIKDTIKIDFINKLIGINIKEKDVKNLFAKVMLDVKDIKNGKVSFEIPPFRSDLWADEDVADDIARAYGYNNIVPTYPNISTIGEELEFSKFRNSITDSMISLGFLELYTYMLTSKESQFKNMIRNEKNEEFLKLIDSEDQGLNMIRTMILPEVLTSLHINRQHKYPQKVFENGFTIQVDEKADTGARNELHLACAIADNKSNYTQIKAVLDALSKLHNIEFEIEESKFPYLIEGRSAKIKVKGKEVGFIGELHPQVLDNFGLLVPVSVFEINLNDSYLNY
jgi:phenylalanyl-tRNA synthetase beta chain